MNLFNRIWNLTTTSLFFVFGVWGIIMAFKYANEGMGWLVFALCMLFCMMGNIYRTVIEWNQNDY